MAGQFQSFPLMKTFLRSTAILAASIASMLPLPDSKPASAKQKKHRPLTHSGRDHDTSAAGGYGGAGRFANLFSPASEWVPSAVLTALVPLATTIAPEAVLCEGRYPWRREIVTTTFWIGEKPARNNPVPNSASSWDPQWAKNFGGTDTPDALERVDYRPAAFVPEQNPFYVALPYNDVTSKGHKPEAAEVIPWFNEDFREPGKTVCKGRWVAIRFKDRVSYAQWEDCGPFRTDHSAYVFGSERPKPNLNKGAGLDVSPAVRDYLGMNDTDVTDWKFVDFSEVPDGPWAKFGNNNTFVINKRLDELRLAALDSQITAPEE